ncbi:MAG: tetratricopeptide repeat protein [Paludibacter sp.]|nr:tetratricopeptide repeat protein [Paludibacter sp.]
MNRKLLFPVDDESSDIVKRYEQFLSGTAPGYFDVEELETIVEFYLRKGRTKDCTKAVDLGLKLHPNNTALKTKRAKIYLATGDELKALHILDKLTESSDYEVILLKIEVLLKLERVKEARMLADKIIADESDDMDNVCLDVAYIYLGQGDYGTALKLLEKGDKFNNQNPELLYELAFCYEQNDDFAKAIVVNNRIITLEPFANEAWFNLGQLYFALQEFPKALDAYEFALAIDQNDSLSCIQKGHVQFQLDMFEEAIDTYQEYKKMTSYGWQTDIFIAECFEKLERYDESISYYRLSLDAHPDNYDALTGIGICLLEQEKYVESMTYIRRALAINNEAADSWVYLAEAYVGLEDLDNALLAYIKAIAIDPDQADTLMAIANICLDKMDYDLAIQYFLSAEELDENLEFIKLFISVAYYKNGEVEKALAWLRKANAESDASISLFLELCPEAEDLNLYETL